MPDQLHTVLCATDFADPAAVAAAEGWCRATGDVLQLVHITEQPDELVQGSAPPEVQPAVDAMRARLRARTESARASLEKLRQQYAASPVTIRVTLESGRPWERLVELASEHAASLLVVGAKPKQQEGALVRRILGTTADRLVRHAPCPVLVVPSGADTSAMMGGRWLVGTDFSEASLAAVRAASVAAERAGSQLVLTHVVPPAGHDEADYAERNWREILREERKKDAERRLAALAAVEAPQAQLEQCVTTGLPGEALCQEVERLGISLLVVGNKGRSLVSLMLGSTAEVCLAQSPVPVMVVRSGSESHVRPAVRFGVPCRIVVGVDFSVHSRRALEWAKELQTAFGATVAAVHVAPAASESIARILPGAGAPSTSAGLSQLQEELEAFCSDVLKDGAGTVDMRVCSGKPAVALLEEARSAKAELVCVGTAGRRGAQRSLLGSVAERLVRTSEIPVLAVQ